MASWLLTDLAALACTYLETRSLLSLRRVSRHWAAASRLPHAWAASHWRLTSKYELEGEEVDAFAILASQLASTFPHLRSITLSDVESRECAQLVPHLKLLERVCVPGFGMPTVLLVSQPRLRSLDLADLQQFIVGPGQEEDDDDDCYYSPEDDRSATTECFNALRLQDLTLARFKWDEQFIDDISRTKMAAHLLCLRVREDSADGPSPKPDLLSRFAALEVLDIRHFSSKRILYHDFQAITQLQHLRVLSYVPYLPADEEGHLLAEDLAALLSSPAFSARLEYLRLSLVHFGGGSLNRIAKECTSLIGLDLELATGRNLKAATEEEWMETQEEGAAMRPTGLHLQSFLAAPQAFRRRLVHLAFGGRFANRKAVSTPQMQRQVWRRFPQLAVVQLDGVTSKPSARFDEPEEDPWLPKETLNDEGDSTSIAHPEPFFFKRDLRRRLFPWVRALKLHCGLPLTPSEAGPQSATFPGQMWDLPFFEEAYD